MIIDFAECLFFARVFLQANLGVDRVIGINDFLTSKKNGENKNGMVVLCPITSVDLLSQLSFDLVINTGSMQEMTEDWITYWMKWLDRINVRYFYSLNYFAQPLDNLEESGNLYSPRLSKCWKMRIRRCNPYFVRLQSFRNTGEILAEKLEFFQSEVPLATEYDIAKEYYLDLQNYMDLVDILRTADDIEMICDFILRVEKDIGFTPKEIYCLLLGLEQNNISKKIPENKKRQIDCLKNKMESIYNLSQKNMVYDALGNAVVTS